MKIVMKRPTSATIGFSSKELAAINDKPAGGVLSFTLLHLDIKQMTNHIKVIFKNSPF
jgi:hypothetical protein